MLIHIVPPKLWLSLYRPVYITGKTGSLVMLADEDYCSLQELLYLSSKPALRKKIVDDIRKFPAVWNQR